MTTPAPQEILDPAVQKRSRRMLVTLALLFFGPIVVATFLYKAGVGPSGRVNHGDLLDPARPLPAVSLPLAKGGETGPGFLRGKWSLVYVGAGECDAACRQLLHRARQVHIALNREQERVQRVFLYAGSCCDRAWLDKEHPDLIVAWADEAGGRELLAPFPVYGNVPVASAGRLYIVDPLGNLVMSYAPTFEDRGLLNDLKKLLQLSSIG